MGQLEEREKEGGSLILKYVYLLNLCVMSIDCSREINKNGKWYNTGLLIHCLLSRSPLISDGSQWWCGFVVYSVFTDIKIRLEQQYGFRKIILWLISTSFMIASDA